MLRFLPMLMVMGVFAAIGIYWAVLSRHFLTWTRNYNQRFHQEINGRQPQPVMVSQAQANYSSRESNEDSTFLNLVVRLIGGGIAGFALIMMAMMLISGI